MTIWCVGYFGIAVLWFNCEFRLLVWYVGRCKFVWLSFRSFGFDCLILMFWFALLGFWVLVLIECLILIACCFWWICDVDYAFGL